jgi:hypothetical protein
VFCIKCGTQNPEGTSFCTKCGASMSSAAGGPPPPAAPGYQAVSSSEVQVAAPVSPSSLLNIMAALVFLCGFVGAILAVTSMEGVPGKAIFGMFIGIMSITLTYSGILVGLSALVSKRR